jgi:hypothetical protein
MWELERERENVGVGESRKVGCVGGEKVDREESWNER